MKTELTIIIDGLSRKNTELFVKWILKQAEEWFVQDEEDGDDEFDWYYEVRKIDD